MQRPTWQNYLKASSSTRNTVIAACMARNARLMLSLLLRFAV